MQTRYNRTILLISNEPDSLENLSLVLQEIGYKVLATNDGTIGFRLIRKERPDLIISEINLPGISGLELCRRIREDRELWVTPLVFLSESRPGSSSLIELFRAGADDCLTEIPTPQYLEAKIEYLIKRKYSENRLTQNYKLLQNRQEEITRIIRNTCNLFTVSKIELDGVCEEIEHRDFEKNINKRIELRMSIVSSLAFLLEKHLNDFDTWYHSRGKEDFAPKQNWNIEKSPANHNHVIYELMEDNLPVN